MEEGEPGSSSMTGPEDLFLEMGKRGAGVKEEEFDDLKEEWDSDLILCLHDVLFLQITIVFGDRKLV